ncbi:NAD-glutamate dehydrogenase [Rhizobium sp. PAMB 3182]
MASRNSSRHERLIEQARALAKESGAPHIDPAYLFGRASNDDLEHYSADMLARSAVHAAGEIFSWDGENTRITISQVEGVEPGGQAASVLCITDRNMPFLYDSVMTEVSQNHRDLFLAVHPILEVSADGSVVLSQPGQKSQSETRVSHIQLHLPLLAREQAEQLVTRLYHVLSQVHLAVRDWRPMLSKLDTAMEELAAYNASRKKSDRDEALAFLTWLRDENFTFLGMRDYVYSGSGASAKVERDQGQGLGLLSDPDVLVLRQGPEAVTTTPEILEFLDGPDFLIVTKANVKSVVHRRAYMDYVGVKRFDKDGNVIGELRIVGLFTSTAYTQATSEIPLLRSKVQKVVDHFGFDPQSHSGKMLMNTLETYPRDDLFQIDAPLLARFCEQINDLSERPRVRVLPRIDHFDRFVSLLVYVPRDEYNSAVREKIGNYFKTVYDGRVSAYYPAFPEGGVARVHFIIGRSTGKTPRVPQAKLEEAVREIASRWDVRFAQLAGSKAPRIETNQAFQEAFTPEEAVADLPHVIACRNGAEISIDFYKSASDHGDILSLKIFHANSHLALSRRVPLLEHLGFNVISERTFELHVSTGDDSNQVIVLHDMELEPQDGRNVDLERRGTALKEAFIAAFAGTVDDDIFNRLILGAGLQAREANVLRAYARYLRQTGITYSQGYLAETLNKYPDIAADLFTLFKERMDPAASDKTRARRTEALTEKIEESLSSVPNLDEDRILRRFMNAIMATLRTNYFQTDADGKPKPVLAFKLDPAILEGLPNPRPFREIFVYGVEVEGVHLRFGKVARGGLRWSDRAQDYRTEVLGLVKAQQVKNAVIVPVGAKGGFYPKQLPAGGSRDEVFNAGREAYKTFIRTMLSITDNIDGNDVVGPADTIRLDGDDPYFVVAADKGTATFSDTANALAQEAGFWLDDAFASGGSAGYDHKKMGITARGAWEAVKRHFREMGTDIQTTPFTVVGVGDMSGDVFGNGMLLSPKIRLLGAFDHRDIFIDPDPNPATSLAERKRLFNLGRSSWQDYNKDLLSKGGMIISRAEKSVKLTAEAAAAIDLNKTVATPFEIMTAILKAPADLLWFGGIGTYIKAPEETDAEVGDRANDPIRINGGDVRARVIGEGANLGVTQKGRIVYGLKGGRCNSDAIDNSAGVNSSDVEVNIKIALASAMRDERLTREKRNTLLASMTPEVAELVLSNNYLQTLAISLTADKGAANGQELGRLMNVLEADGHLDRHVETLPDDAAMTERYASGKTLTRSEIGVLLSYAKIVLFDELVASDLPDDPYFADLLAGYFPQKMQRTYAQDIAGHRLRREIISTLLGNETINWGGPGFIVQIGDATGATSADIVKAAAVVRDGFDLTRLWEETHKLDGAIDGSQQNAIYAEICAVHAMATQILAKTGVSANSMAEHVDAIKAAMKKLKSVIPTLISEEIATGIGEREARMIDAGVPEELAKEIAALRGLLVIPDIIEIATDSAQSLQRAAIAFFEAGKALHVDQLIVSGNRVVTADHYDTLALVRCLDQIASARRRIAVAAMTGNPNHKSPVSAWISADKGAIERMAAELRILGDKADPTLAKVAVAAGILNDLAQTASR